MGKYLWMCVEADEYELPLAVADTAKELAEKCGVTTNNVILSAKFDLGGKKTKTKYIRVMNE